MLNDILSLFGSVFSTIFEWFRNCMSVISPIGINFILILVLVWLVYRFLVTPFLR